MPRFFTFEQAEKLLPDVQSAIRAAIAQKKEYDRAESDWVNFSQRLTMVGGALVDRDRAVELKRSREDAAQALKHAVDRIQDFGCLVKDLDIGLIDFPTLFHGEEVYLCWKLGEAGIQFWHGVHEGFRGRKIIDAAFLANHRGEAPN